MDINTCFTTIGDLRSLALYANFVPAVTSIILAVFVLLKAQNRQKAMAFASFVGVFALWLIAAGIIWTSDNYYLVAALWTPIDYFQLLFFLLLFCFFYLDIFTTMPRWLSVIVFLVAMVSFVINIMGQGASGFDQPWCNMYNSEFLTSYDLWVGILILLSILGLGIYRFLKLKNDRNERIRISIITGSILLFMGIFLGSSYISSNLGGNYTIELYALFTLPIFILLLTISITSYGTFRLGDMVAKALFYIFLVVSAAGFFFVNSVASFVLTAIAFVVTLSFGVLLLRSYEREALIRKQVEKLAVELEATNERQETLIHFIGHEVKGTLTKDMAVFASLTEGDFGKLPEATQSFVSQALLESRQGADAVTNILKASNLKKGTVTYAKAPFDLKTIVTEAVNRAKIGAEKKGLSLQFLADDASYTMVGDGEQINDHVLRNLIDNAINYTPSGSIEISLKTQGNKHVFAVKDSGIGITTEDKKRLFTEGGHGKDSQKVNAHSTGYGLYIAKQVVEAHGGTIRVESEGAGKGATFIVEFPSK